MVCNYCGHKTQVINSRLQKRHNQVWRRRFCPACKSLFTTHESLQLSAAHSVIKAGSVEPLNADKLFTDVLLALQDSKKCYEDARALTATILGKLLKNQTAAIEAEDISKAVSDVLKRFNRRAWLRYAAEHPSVKA